MSRNQVEDAIERWAREGLLDDATAARLRAEVAEYARTSTGRLSQYVLAFTGAVVLILAGAVFLEWAWPFLDDATRTLVLAVLGVAVVSGGSVLEGRRRWQPAAVLMQVAGLGLILAAYVWSEQAWADGTPAATAIGFAALATPVVLTARAMRRSAVMPAVYMTACLGFLAIFLDRNTGLDEDAIVWILDGVLGLAIVALVGLVRSDPEGDRHPWALNTFVAAMGAGFVLVSLTGLGPLSLSDGVFLPLDAWLAACAALTVWGVHRAPPGLRRAWFERLLAWELVGWIGLGLSTAFETFDGPPELGVVMVAGVAVVAFRYADRYGFRELMGASALAFIVPVWWWAIDRAGALGGVLALLATAGLLFWASGRRRQDGDDHRGHDEGDTGPGLDSPLQGGPGPG